VPEDADRGLEHCEDYVRSQAEADSDAERARLSVSDAFALRFRHRPSLLPRRGSLAGIQHIFNRTSASGNSSP
jgi:hypothetical protein